MDDTLCLICHVKQALFVGPYCSDCSISYLPFTDHDLPEFQDYIDTQVVNISHVDDSLTEEIGFSQQVLSVSNFTSSYFSWSAFGDYLLASRDDILLVQNIRSVPKNLEHFITQFQEFFDGHVCIICFTETWYNDNNIHCYKLPNYIGTHVYRSNKKGGGVSIFVRNPTNFTRLDDLCYNEPFLESVAIHTKSNDIQLGKGATIINIYRPPNTKVEDFMVLLDILLEKLSYRDEYIFIVGDFNIDMANYGSDIHSTRLINSCISCNLRPTISIPTRINKQSHTLLDNIFTNFIGKNQAGVIQNDITDHFSVFMSLKPNTVPNNEECMKIWNYNINTINKYQKLINEMECLPNVNNSTQIMYTTLNEKLSLAHNVSFSRQAKKITYKNKLPWINETLRSRIREKNKMYIKWVKYRTQFNFRNYKRYKSTVNKELNCAKRKFYDNKIKRAFNSNKQQWQIINEIMGKDKNITLPTVLIDHEGSMEEEGQIANAFNNYFSKIGPELALLIPDTPQNYLEYMDPVNQYSMFLDPVTTEEIVSVLNNIKTRAEGIDNISTRIIKNNIHTIARLLLPIVNQSFLQGVVPKELKIAKVIPYYKSGDKNKLGNYRPIAVLPLFSKVWEKLFFDRLTKFLDKHNIVYTHQYGFRKKFSTDSAVFTLVNHINDEFEKGNYVVGIFLDLSKAFDTLNTNILLNKLYRYGIRGIPYNWLNSYLSERTQQVLFKNILTNKLSTDTGVPQGSILGPILFLLYINDLPNFQKNVFTLMFADDSSIFFSGPNLDDLMKQAKDHFAKIKTWIETNKLSLNLQKTKFMIFSTKKISKNYKYIATNNGKIERVNTIKFLGFSIQENLKWTEHVHNIMSKISKGIGIMRKVRKSLGKEALLTIYYSFVYPHIRRGLIIWGQVPKSYLIDILLKQKCAVRIISGAGYRDHTVPLFKQLDILPINLLYIQQLLILMYNVYHNKCPEHIANLFKLKIERTDRSTRQTYDYIILYTKLKSKLNSPLIQAPKHYNMYKKKLDFRSSIGTQKRNIKKMLFATYQNNFDA